MTDTLPIDSEVHILHFYGLKEVLPETWDDSVLPTNNQHVATKDATNAATVLNETDGAHGRVKQFRTEAETAANAANAAAQLEAEIERAAHEADDYTDPLGVLSQDVVRAKVRSSPQLSLSCRTFQPRAYLTEVHLNTSYEQLYQGAEKLASVQAQRTDLLKTVVKTHFERFVNAKNTVDQVYVDLKQKVLEQPGYGTAKFDALLHATLKEAKQIFEPMMERRKNVDRIRDTMAILRRFRFYFNLPSTLHESIMQRKDEQTVRDYRRGKILMQAVLNTSTNSAAMGNRQHPIPNATTKTSTANGAQPCSPELQKVFGKIWQQVEAHIAGLRARLLRDLNDVMLSQDRQEQTIRWLLQLDGKEDPVRVYLTACANWFKTEARRCFVDGVLQERAVLQRETQCFKPNVLGALAPLPSTLHELVQATPEATKARKYQFRKQIRLCGTKEFDLAFADDIQLNILSIRWQTIRALRTALGRIAPKYWHIVQQTRQAHPPTSASGLTSPTDSTSTSTSNNNNSHRSAPTSPLRSSTSTHATGSTTVAGGVGGGGGGEMTALQSLSETTEEKGNKMRSYLPFVKGHKHNKLSISKSQPAPTPQEQAQLTKVREDEETMSDQARLFTDMLQTYGHYACHALRGEIPDDIKQLLDAIESPLRGKENNSSSTEKPLPSDPTDQQQQQQQQGSSTASKTTTISPTVNETASSMRRASIFASSVRRPTLASLTTTMPPSSQSMAMHGAGAGLTTPLTASKPSLSLTSLNTIAAPPVFPTAADAEKITNAFPLSPFSLATAAAAAATTLTKAWQSKFKCQQVLLLAHMAPRCLQEELNLYNSLAPLCSPFEESLPQLKTGILRFRDLLLDDIRGAWEKEAKVFFVHHDAARHGFSCEPLVDLFYSMQKTILRHLLPVALTMTCCLQPSSSSSAAAAAAAISQPNGHVKDVAMVHWQRAFVDTIFSFLDTLHFMSFASEYATHFLPDSPEAKNAAKVAASAPAATAGQSGAGKKEGVAASSATSMETIDVPTLPRDRWAGLGAGEGRRSQTTFLPAFNSYATTPILLTEQRKDGSAAAGYREEERWLKVLAGLLILRSRVATKLQTAFSLTISNTHLPEKLQSTYMPDLTKALESTDLLRQKILDAYVKRKTVSVKEMVKQGMAVVMESPWTLQPAPQGIRSYITDILTLLVETKSEIREHLPLVDPYTGATLQDTNATSTTATMTADKMTQHVIRRLSKNAFDHIAEYAKQIPQFSAGAATQLIGEVQCLKRALSVDRQQAVHAPSAYVTPPFIQTINTVPSRHDVYAAHVPAVGAAGATTGDSNVSYFGQHCQESVAQLEATVNAKITSAGPGAAEGTIKATTDQEAILWIEEAITQKLRTVSLICAALTTT